MGNTITQRINTENFEQNGKKMIHDRMAKRHNE